MRLARVVAVGVFILAVIVIWVANLTKPPYSR